MKDLVLVGGGHTNALLCRMLGMRPLSGLRVTLISDTTHTPYSGMLPGLIAGHYTFDQAHIDLRKLCDWAGVRFILDSACKIDPTSKIVRLNSSPPVEFDILSINTGSTPQTSGIRGAREFSVPVKPVHQFLGRLDNLKFSTRPKKPTRISIIGGGTGGVELAFALYKQTKGNAKISIFQRAPEIIPEQNQRVRELALKALLERGIDVSTEAEVLEVGPRHLTLKGDREVASDFTVLVTHGAPPPFLKDSGLINHSGFIEVNSKLQSVDYPYIFAAGDVAEQSEVNHEKSGVYAVRQAKPLAKNIQALLFDQPLVAYYPQKDFLRLIGTADGKAIASHSKLAWHSSVMWRLKQNIDQRFMNKFSQLKFGHSGTPSLITKPNFQRDAADIAGRANRWCKGCAGKVGARALQRALSELKGDRIQLDDAALIEFGDNCKFLQSIDHLSAFISDEYLFARIAINHAFSDIYAMGGQGHSALVSIQIPYSSETISSRIIARFMLGVEHQLNLLNADLLGGHSYRADSLAVSIVANGLPGSQMLTKCGTSPGDRLILTKPLGSGVLLAAHMRGKAKGVEIDQMLEEMLIPNLQASTIISKFKVSSCTDVTGFGLAGHLFELLQNSGTSAALMLDKIPTLQGAESLLARGIESSIAEENRWLSRFIRSESESSSSREGRYPLLFDPQTAGGLLFTVAPEDAEPLCAALHEGGYQSAAVIGEIQASEESGTVITI